MSSSTLKVPCQWPRVKPCKVAFIGEAPGEHEEAKGVPFIGPSGRLFNQMLAIAGVDRNECLVTNVFDFKLEDNSVESICAGTKEAAGWKEYDLPSIFQRGAARYYLRPEFLGNLGRLDGEIRCCMPHVLVALGGTALWALTGHSNIKMRRGAVHEASLIATGTKVVPTYHPAYIMQYAYRLMPLVVMDIIKAMAEGDTPEISTSPRRIRIKPDVADLYRFSDEFIFGTPTPAYLSVDIETPFVKSGLPEVLRSIKCVGISVGSRDAIVAPFVDSGSGHSYWKSSADEVAAIRWLKSIMECPIPKLGQNFGAFDAQWLWDRWRIVVRNQRFDTRLAHHVLQPELPKDLGTLGALYARERAWKTMREHAIKRDE